MCHRPNCYQPIPPNWRYAQELFPEFKKERIPVARFLCRLRRRTFSLLPIQLAPYCQYTLTAIIGALLLGLGERKQGQQGFQGAVLTVATACLKNKDQLMLRLMFQDEARFRRSNQARVLGFMPNLSGAAFSYEDGTDFDYQDGGFYVGSITRALELLNHPPCYSWGMVWWDRIFSSPEKIA